MGVIPAHAFTGEGQSDHVLVGSTGSDWDPGKDLSGSGATAEVDLVEAPSQPVIPLSWSLELTGPTTQMIQTASGRGEQTA